jgi:hypothetical protein
VIDSGNNQTAGVNHPLPKPLIAVVVDAGHNRLAGVPVTFTVVQGGGSFGGQASVPVTTDSDGRVAATPTLGFQEGNSNNLITATFPGNAGFPASFTASGLGPGDPAKTVISGLVLDNSNQPVPGVTVRALLTNALTASMTAAQTAAAVQTDAKGQFSIYKAPVGYVKLLVDGSTATATGAFPSLEYDMVTVAGQINTVNQSIYLLPIKSNNKLCVDATTGGGTLTIPEAPGFSLTFGPGQVTFPGGSKAGCVSVTVVHPDKVPMVPGFGQQPRFIVTIQPSGELFNPPASITLPNVDGLAPREVTEMYSFDHDIGSFVAIGTGTVSDDGQVIRSSVGVGVLKAGWHCGGNSSIAGTAGTCLIGQRCVGNQCSPDNSQVPPQISPTDCLKEVCSGGYITHLPDNGETPPQNSPTDCLREVCSGGIVDSIPDGGETPPQVRGNCQKEVCLAGGVQMIDDDSDEPPNISGNCMKETCYLGKPAFPFDSTDTPTINTGTCCNVVCTPGGYRVDEDSDKCKAIGGVCNACQCVPSGNQQIQLEFNAIDTILHILAPHPPIAYFRPTIITPLLVHPRIRSTAELPSGTPVGSVQAHNAIHDHDCILLFTSRTRDLRRLLVPSGESHISPVSSRVTITSTEGSVLSFQEQQGFLIKAKVVNNAFSPVVGVPYSMAILGTDNTVFDSFEFPVTDSNGSISLAMPPGVYRLRIYLSSANGPFDDRTVNLNGNTDLGQIVTK